MRRARSARRRGQTMVEFALVAPVFLLVVFATIDYGGYFGTRLSVENASRAGARVAAVLGCGAGCTSASFSNPNAATIVNAIESHSNVELVPNTVDCLWDGSTLAPTVYPPFKISSGTACIGVWYFELKSATGVPGPPTLCTQWSVAYSSFGLYSTAGVWTSASSPPTGCVEAKTNLVVVGLGYTYSPFTPMPSITQSALTTYGETQLLEEQ